MTTICVSDLHCCCGPTDPRDNFAFNGRPERFNAFLDWVEDQDARLYVLGDLLDFYQANISACIQANWQLLSRLDMMGATLIFGNHDDALVHFIGTNRLPPWPLICRARRPFVETIGSRKFLFMHGHEADPYCKDDKPGKGQLTAIASALLEDKHGSPFDRRGRAIEEDSTGVIEEAVTLWRKLTFHPSRVAELINGVEEYRIARSADVVCSGHTHQAGRIGEHHYNSGSWARDWDTFIAIDDSTGQASVMEWTHDCTPVPFDHLL